MMKWKDYMLNLMKQEGAAKTTERTEVAESATDELTDQEQSIIQAELDEQQAQSEVSKVKKARGKRRQKEAEATEKGEPPPAKEKKVKKAKAEKAKVQTEVQVTKKEPVGNVEFMSLGMVNPIVPFNVEAGYLSFAPLDIPQQLTTEIEAVKGSAENDKVAKLEASLANVNADVEKVKALVAELTTRCLSTAA